MEDVARLHVEPGHVVRTTVAFEEPHAWLVIGIPAVGEAGSRHGRFDVEHDGEVVNDREAFGERHVVDAHRTAYLDVDDLADKTTDVDHRVLHHVAPTPEIGHGVELARCRVAFGVGRIAAGQRAVEVARADSVELVGELVR